MSTNSRLNKVFSLMWNTKRWRNESNYCNRKTHPFYFPYRRYKRGKNRCSCCGAKIGKIKCVRKSCRTMLVDSIFSTSPMLSYLRKKKVVV